DIHTPLSTREHGFQIDIQMRAHLHRRARTTSRASAALRPRTEQRLEEITEATLSEALGALPTSTPARWLEIVTRSPATGPDAVVFGAPGRISQHLMGLVGGLEPFFGVRLLAHVRMEFPRQAPVGRLDCLFVGVRCDAEHLVVILELH